MVPPQESQSDEIEKAEKESQARKELVELGLETNRENIEAVVDQMSTRQIQEGYEDLIEAMDNPEELKAKMEEKGIKRIVHAEGLTVWDHVKATMAEVEKLGLPEEEDKDLKILMLYHDLGKTEAAVSEESQTASKKALKKGRLFTYMMRHASLRGDDITRGLEANGIKGRKLEIFQQVIGHHMETSLLEQDPKKTFNLFSEFGDTDEDRKEVVALLVQVLHVDGEATQQVELVDGELKYSKNEKKQRLDLPAAWKEYEKGEKIIAAEKAKAEKKAAADKLEKEIFGTKLSVYLIENRGVKQGPEVGKAIGKVKGIIAKNRGKSPQEIREIVDSTEI